MYDMTCTDAICAVKMYIILHLYIYETLLLVINACFKHRTISRKVKKVTQIDGVKMCVLKCYLAVIFLITAQILFYM